MTRPRQHDLTDGTGGDQSPPEKKPQPRPMDQALRLAGKIDRLLEKMPAWARTWCLNFLWAKYMRAPGVPATDAQEG